MIISLYNEYQNWEQIDVPVNRLGKLYGEYELGQFIPEPSSPKGYQQPGIWKVRVIKKRDGTVFDYKETYESKTFLCFSDN